MAKCLYGTRSVAYHFEVPEGKIRWMMYSGKIHPAKNLVGEFSMYAFTEKDLKDIARILEKEKAAQLH